MNKLIMLVVVFSAITLRSQAQENVLYQQKDRVIFEQFLQYTASGSDISHIANYFIDTPYVSGTLEGDSIELLRVNFRELDCFTLVENVIALHLLLKSNNRSFENFCAFLQQIRYRDGFPDGYLSRLHYTSEWLDNNAQKGIFSLPVPVHCQVFAPNVSFMSVHCNKYPALAKNKGLCTRMADIEKHINQLEFCYIPKEKVSAEIGIKNGDILAITTHIKGLDIAHVGFAVVRDGQLYLLHASSEAKKVIITKESLHQYLINRKNHSGIIVARITN